jgi:hypothetical protein
MKIRKQPNQYAIKLSQLKGRIDFTYVKVLNLSNLQLNSLDIQLN